MSASRDQVGVDEWINTNHHKRPVVSPNDRINRAWLYKVASTVIVFATGAYLFLR